MQNKKITILFLALSFVIKFSQAQTNEAVLAYISAYKDLAVAEMQRSGIPASIILAQGIHETEAGTSDLVKMSNNHFGIKCKSVWTGETVSHDDDARGECFRKYATAADSYKDHSDFLRGSDRYSFLFNYDPTDYEKWAYGLKKAGYATNPKYPQILIKLIKDYNLQDYTLLAMGKMKPEEILVKNNSEAQNKTTVIAAVNKNTVEETQPLASPAIVTTVNYPEGEFKINETRVVFVKKGTSFLTIAQQYEIPLARLFDFNDMRQKEIADEDQLIFIQRKRKTGAHETHTVQPGETIFSIAQTEAIRLESLLEYNNLQQGMQPAVGEILNLQSKNSGTPKLASNVNH